MTITINVYYFHGVVSVLFLVALFLACEAKRNYDFGGGFRAFVVILAYCVYWILYLALTR